jgi:hypothetical protein
VPNRYVRAAVLESERYHSVGPHERLAFFELLLLADDFGIVPLHPMFLSRRTTAFAGLSVDAIQAKIHTLDQQDLIRCFSVDNSSFAWIPRNDFYVRAKKPLHPLPDFEAPQYRNRFNALKQLAKKRTSSAQHVRGGRDADAVHAESTSTSTSTSTSLELLPHSVDTAATPEKIGVAPACPIDKIVSLWNTIVGAAGGQKALNLSKARRELITRRWREVAPANVDEGLAFFESVFRDRIAASKFCTGRTPGRDGRPYRIGIDVVMRSEQQFDQICEGKYA